MPEPPRGYRRVDADVQRPPAAGDVAAEAAVAGRGACQYAEEHPQTPETPGLEGLAVARGQAFILFSERAAAAPDRRGEDARRGRGRAAAVDVGRGLPHPVAALLGVSASNRRPRRLQVLPPEPAASSEGDEEYSDDAEEEGEYSETRIDSWIKC